MKYSKNLLIAAAVLFVFGFCAVSFATAQTPASSQNAQQRLNSLKDKRKIFVISIGEKNALEEYLRKTGRFEVVAQQKDAEIIYSSYASSEQIPGFGKFQGGVLGLALLSESVDPTTKSIYEPAKSDSRTDEYRVNIWASVYLASEYKNEPFSPNVPLWSDKKRRFVGPDYPRLGKHANRQDATRKDELQLLKKFIEDVENLG